MFVCWIAFSINRSRGSRRAPLFSIVRLAGNYLFILFWSSRTEQIKYTRRAQSTWKIGRRSGSNTKQCGALLSMASPSPQNIAMAPPVQNPTPAQSPHNQYPPNPAAPPTAQQQSTPQQQVNNLGRLSFIFIIFFRWQLVFEENSGKLQFRMQTLVNSWLNIYGNIYIFFFSTFPLQQLATTGIKTSWYVSAYCSQTEHKLVCR